MSERKKAARNPPMFATLVPFGLAFPEIDQILVTVQEKAYDKKCYRYTKDSLDEYVTACSNRLCDDSGFRIGPLLREMYDSRETEWECLQRCSGHEHMGGPHKTRMCMNHYDVRVSIKYKEK